MKLKFGIAAMMIAACAVAFSACDSDDPITDPETPETPIEPEFPTGPAEPLTDEIRPVLTDGKKWTCKYMWADTKQDGIDIVNCHIDGETSVRGVNAKIIKHVNLQGEVLSTSFQREENGIISEEWPIEYYNSQPTGYYFLYAYEVNPQQGKQFTDHMSKFKIISKGTIVLMGKTRRAVLIKEIRDGAGKHYIYDLWVEGIGPLFGSKGFYEPGVPTTPRYYLRPMYVKMLECYDGDEKIYDHREFSPERYNPEVVFYEPDADAYEIMAKMADGSFVTEWNESWEEPDEPYVPGEPLTENLRPVLTDGKKWIRNQTWEDSGWNRVITYSVAGDTTYNGLAAKKIKREANNQYPSIEVEREENSTVYRLCEVDEQDYEYVYDFRYIYDVQPDAAGTIEDSSGLQYITYVSKGTIVLQGKTRRATLIKAKRSYHETLYDIWVEGVGPLFGIACWNHFVFASTDVYGWNPMYNMLLECYDGEEKIYDYTEFSYNKYKAETMFIDTESDETIKNTFKAMIMFATE